MTHFNKNIFQRRETRSPDVLTLSIIVISLVTVAIILFLLPSKYILEDEFLWLWKNGLRAEATVTMLKPRLVPGWRGLFDKMINDAFASLPLPGGQTVNVEVIHEGGLKIGDKVLVVYLHGQFDLNNPAVIAAKKMIYPTKFNDEMMAKGHVYTERLVAIHAGIR